MMYYMFNEPALNGFDNKLESAYANHPEYHLIDSIKIPTKSLKDILNSTLPKNTPIDFLSIDTEGLDFEVLSSNDWERYAPKVVLIESWDSTIDSISANPIYQFLHDKNYSLYAKTANTLIFKSNAL